MGETMILKGLKSWILTNPNLKRKHLINLYQILAHEYKSIIGVREHKPYTLLIENFNTTQQTIKPTSK